jgi:PAS domain S-box-containing protein
MVCFGIIFFMRETLNYKRNKILISISVAAMIMVVSIFFFIPYTTEKYITESISSHAIRSMEQIKLTRQYYVKRIVNDIKSQSDNNITFHYNHEEKIGILPLPTTLIHDLSKLFSDHKAGITYKLYSQYPFKNRVNRVLTPFQEEAIAYTTKYPKQPYIKRDTIHGREVLRVATADSMSAQACVACHNHHPDRTWSQNKWKLGDSRGVLEATLPIEHEIESMREIRNYLIGFINIVFLSILYYLYRVFSYREQELTNVADKLEVEVNTLNEIIDEHALISKTDLKGKITYASKEFARISGYRQEELVGKPHNIVRHPNVPKSLYKKLWDTIKSNHIWSGDIQNRAKDGSSYYVYAKIFPIYDKNQTKIGYAAIRNDITDRVRSQQALNEARKLHQIVTDNQQSILVMTNDSEGVLSFNKRFFEIFDFENLETFKMKHECICELFIEKEGYISPNYERGQWVDVVLSNPGKVHKVLMQNKEGEERIFSVLIKVVELDSKRSYVSTLTDITELERARQTAESSERAKSEFMANMSHELRTPLNGIHGFTELLEKTALDAKQSKYLSIMKSSIKNLLQIINDILDFSKIQSGNMTLNSEEINPFIDLKEALELFSSTCKTKNIDYMVYIDSQISETILVDKLRLIQVLTNLINNAVKFTSNGGVVTVDITFLKEENGVQTIRFGVRDTGIGISKENQKKIFEAFTQADSSTTRQYGGTGLGLSISASLVELLGGKLQLESKKGEGSYFFFELEVTALKSEIEASIHGIESQPIKIINAPLASESIDRVLEQLKHFRVHYHLIESKKEEELTSALYIVFNLEDLKWCNNGVNRIILIYSDSVDETFPSNIYHIPSFYAFPSKLYNAIMELDSIQLKPMEGDAPLKKETFSLKALVVEDYLPNQILIEELLAQYGVTITIANNGKEALEMITDGYDIVFMDINMPEMNGVEATRKIRESGDKVPIIALTANALEGDEERFIAEGMDDYLSKPIEVEKLYRVLKKYANG